MAEPKGAAVGRALRVAVTQWHATRDIAGNVVVALDMVAEAGRKAADLVLLPENGLMLGSNAEMRQAALGIDSPEIGAIRDAARRIRSTVIIGGFKRRDVAGTIYNTALVISPRGEVAGGYDKIHMFDATIDGRSFAASSVETPGKSPTLAIVNGVKIGLTICYDVRFPELFRRLALAGAEAFVVPSAFTYTTGKAHWETLLRARAIENGAFVVASATVRGGDGGDAMETYGHALAVGPWGEVLADLGEAPQSCLVVELRIDEVGVARRMLPVLRSVSPASYGAPVEIIKSSR